MTMKTSQLFLTLAAMSGAMFPQAAATAELAKSDLSGSMQSAASVPVAEAAAVVAFWRDAGPAMWFAKDAAFDRRFRERFLHCMRRRRAAS